MVLDYFTNLTRTFPFEEVRPGMMGPLPARKEPVGVVAGMIPWNVPLFITMLKFAPTLASGSAMVSGSETPIDEALCSPSWSSRPAYPPASSTSRPPAARSANTW